MSKAADCPRTTRRHPLDVRAAPDRVRRGFDQRQMAAQYAGFGPQLARLAYLLTGDSQLAQDLVHEAFARAFARRRVLRGGDEAMVGYLRATLLNLARKHWRSRDRERRALARHHHLADRASLPAADIDDRERLWLLLRQLPPRQRAAVVLRFYLDLSERDTARALGCPTGTAKSLVHRALTTLRSHLEAEP